MTAAEIVVLPGDGIGPEVCGVAADVLRAVAGVTGLKLRLSEHLIGGAAIDATGDALPAATRDACAVADAVLLGAVGGPKWSDPDAPVRPEKGLLDLREVLGVYANLRPVKPFPATLGASPLKADRLEGTDLLVVRELTGGVYFGAKREGDDFATDECRYHVHEIERIVRRAAELAATRRGRLVSVDKANVLATSRLWRRTVDRLMPAEFPDIQYEHLLVDAAAMHLLSRPASFDVIVTENMFGDILTDEASMLAGSLGLLPSASLGEGTRGLYEPIHGSAPDIAGRGVANPYGTVLSAAMLLRYSLGADAAADRVEAAVAACLDEGIGTADIFPRSAASTAAVGEALCERIIG